MNKIKTLVRAPVLTQSGYGIHSRQIVNALLQDEKIDLYVEAVNWGGCAHLSENTPEVQQLKQLWRKFEYAKHNGQDKDFGLFISVTIPQEFERRGAINIGVTAAAETDRCSPDWLKKCNEMDLIVVPSLHAHKNLAGTVLNWSNNQTHEMGQLKLERPIVIAPEGFDSRIFREFPHLKTRIKDLKFTAPFNFLLVGQWSGAGYGEDRKNIGNSILYFLRAFKGRKDVGLVLKVNLARNSAIDAEMVTARIKAIKSNFSEKECPPIHLISDTFSDEEMGELYNHPQIKAFLTLTHGEGYGLPILEAAASGLPIIATNWSGHLDFLTIPKSTERLFSGVEYDLKPIPPAAVWEPVLIKDSQWAVPREQDAIHRMRKMVSDYALPKKWAKKLAEHVRANFEIGKVSKDFLQVVDSTINASQGQALTTPEGLASIIDDPEAYNILYTMPMSSGDVFISTAVIDGLVKQVRQSYDEQRKAKGQSQLLGGAAPQVHLYFATMPQYEPILKGNPNIHKILTWQQSMMDVNALEDVFDLVLTPNVSTQFVFSNWVRGGEGRLLAEEFANHCQAPLGDYFIEEDDSVFTDVLLSQNGEADMRHQPYITVHPGSGQGQWEARKYVEWPETLQNLKAIYPTLKIVQVGGADEPLFEQTDIDMRGQTSVQQLASLIKNSKCHVSIDTFTMHIAASYHVPLVALFGSSHAGSTGPWYKDPSQELYVLLESQNKMGCAKACYKYQCKVNASLPCINEIDSQEVVRCVSNIISKTTDLKAEKPYYKRIFPKISGYTTSYNALTMGYPFIESISSMLGFCDEVVVADHSTDGTYEILEKMAADEPRIKLYQAEWDQNNPTMDGDSKAYARAFCEFEYCWQQDLDEVVHERDYDKIKWITKRFPSQAKILHLPVVECWGDADHGTGRRHSWKWRLSKNEPNITHGVNKHARITNPETGDVYAREGMSDGCEYVDLVSYENLNHTGFYTQEWEMVRQQNPEQYGELMNSIMERVPSVYHYSWFNLGKKIDQFRINWDAQWSRLYQKEMPPRFPKDADKAKLVEQLYRDGGEPSDHIKYKWKLNHSHPAIMQDWIEENSQGLKKTGT